jgi:hypothetical protein
MRRLVLCACLFVACGENAGQPSPAASAAPSASAATAPSAAGSEAGASYKDADLPVPGDFEEEAEKSLTPSNYKEKLAELRGEIAPDEPAPSAQPSAQPSAVPSATP